MEVRLNIPYSNAVKYEYNETAPNTVRSTAFSI